jgi:galactokinase
VLSDFVPNATYRSIAPGRVNLLGEHVDYNDGMVLPAAIDRCVTLIARPRSDRLVMLRAHDLNETITFSLDALSTKADVLGQPLPGWALYPAAVAWSLQDKGLATNGIQAAFASNVPIGAGLSSSAAVEVAFAALWQEMNGWSATHMDLAKLSQRAENVYVGVNCGLMDQFASANGVDGHALYFDTRSLEFHPVPLPAGTVIVIADSGVRRSLTTSAYNDRRAACEQAVALLKPHLPGMTALRDVTPADFAKWKHVLPALVAKRAQHIVEECARMEEAVQVLEAGDAAAFGRLMAAGHASLRDLYEVSCPELDILVADAQGLPGCFGARLTGAGFGGCTVNLVAEDQAEAFIASLKKMYEEKTRRKAEVYLCRASQGVHVEKI